MNLLSNDSLDIERWRRIESVLDPALELPRHEVAAYLDRACAAHPELRAEIEALLEADLRAQEFLSVPAFVRANFELSDAATQSVAAELLLHEQIGAYRVIGELGRGGMGIVHLGRDDALGREVAIKALPGAVADDPERLARFLHEARLLGMLHDPRIAQIYGLEIAGGRRYLILERVAGTTLSECLRAGALPLDEAIDVCAQVGAALATAHAYGVVHRDLKPGNIMRTPEGLVKVLDFGLAIHVPAGELRDASTAEPRAGTPGFMSPEQILGQPQDARSDLFALGAVLYQCLTGARAFAGGTPYTVIDATLHAPPDFARLPAATPEPVRSLLAALLEKDAALRPRDAAEVAAALGAAVARSDAPRLRADDAAVRELPHAATPLVGRRRELADIRGLLQRAPLVTLVGAGGCGKTRLAIEAAHESDAGPVGFADLAAVADAHAVTAAIAAAVDARDPSETAIVTALGAVLGTRPGPLVIDNCDRVAEPVAALASRLLARVRGLRILATSRERLGIAGEQVLRVTPLPLPKADTRLTRDAVSAADAVRMFVACASAVRPGFTLTDANAGIVTEICRDLDGVPLAIELTAALLATHTLEDAARALHERARQRHAVADPLEAALALSYDKLPADEQRLFRALAVFAGGWTLESAVAVCEGNGDPFATLDRLTRLIDKSLVAIQRVDRVAPRYRFLEPVRHFAVARCAAAGEAAALRERHLDWFLGLTERAVPSLLHGADQARSLASLEADHANLLAALEACDTAVGGATLALRLAGAAWLFWYIRGHFERGRKALALALNRPGAQAATTERAQALFAAGGLAVFQGDFVDGRRLSEQALALYEALGDPLGVARSLSHLALCDSAEGRMVEARDKARRAIDAFRAAGDARRLSAALNNLGALERQLGDYVTALPQHEEALELLRRAGDRDGTIVTLVNLGLVSGRLGRLQDATRHVDEALALVQGLRARRAAANALEVAAEVLGAREQAEDGARLLGGASELRSAMGLAADASWRRTQDEVIERLREALGASRFEAALAAGRELGFEHVIEEARARLAAWNETPVEGERQPS